MYNTGTLILNASTLFDDIDRWGWEPSEKRKIDILNRLNALKENILEERAHLAVNHAPPEKEKGYIPYPNLSDGDLTRSICILNGLLPLIELSKAAVKGELKVYKVVYVYDGDEEEIYTGYSLEEACKAAENDTYEIRIYTPWKPIELMDKADLAELFDEGGQFADYEIYKEAKA